MAQTGRGASGHLARGDASVRDSRLRHGERAKAEAYGQYLAARALAVMRQLQSPPALHISAPGWP